jgi:hypothetical protein
VKKIRAETVGDEKELKRVFQGNGMDLVKHAEADERKAKCETRPGGRRNMRLKLERIGLFRNPRILLHCRTGPTDVAFAPSPGDPFSGIERLV